MALETPNQKADENLLSRRLREMAVMLRIAEDCLSARARMVEFITSKGLLRDYDRWEKERVKVNNPGV